VLIASVMEECRREAWHEIIQRVEATGVDGFELNLSCPHGLPERKMGSAMGQEPEIVQEVCSWAREATRKPIWAKLTPNITDITEPGRAALETGIDGLSAINTILSVMSINLDTLRPEPTVEGHSTPGGYSGKAIRPIAMRMVMELARMIGGASPRSLQGGGQGVGEARVCWSDSEASCTPSTDQPLPSSEGERPSLSAIGGVETGEDAAQYLLLGANTVQVCTGVMIHGYGLIHQLQRGLSAFMQSHGFATIEEFRGASLPYFTTHGELVARQRAAKSARARTLQSDAEWTGETFVAQSASLTARG
jgi:dihydroorotate dehydrogenase